MGAVKKSKSVRRVRPGPVTDVEARERDQLIIKIATEEFLEKGYERATLATIASRCRISKTTIYRLFKDKEALFRHIAAEAMQKRRYDVESLLNTDGGFASVIRRSVSALFDTTDFVSDIAILRLAIAERDRFPTIAKMMMDHTLVVIRPLAKYLQSVSTEPRLSDDQATMWALHLMNVAIGGYASLLAPIKPLFRQDQWVDSVTALFMSGFPVARKHL
jgi:AcrR family transcriptional regulator